MTSNKLLDNEKAVDKTRDFSKIHRVIVKVGSAVLTNLSGTGELDKSVIASLSAQIAELNGKGVETILVSSGAVAAGRGVFPVHNPITLPERQAAAAIGQARLMHAYNEEFAKYKLIAAQVLLTRDDLELRERFFNVRNTLLMLLNWGAIPIINENDSVAVQELVYGDNDILAALFLNVAEADMLINLTSANGVFSENPLVNPSAEPIPFIEDIFSIDIESMCSGKTAIGSGGMRSKLLAARRAAQLGAPTLILPGREPKAILRALDGEPVGTFILPEEKTIPRRKFRLVYNREPKGSLTVDSGAATALREHGKSLLPAGIIAVDGAFETGDLVRILDPSGRTVGLGMSNYPHENMRKIAGLRSSCIEEVLGYFSYPEAVHRDNMLVDPAV